MSYPILTERTEFGEQIVVLFIDEKRGIVVYDSVKNCINTILGKFQEWDISEFKPYKGIVELMNEEEHEEKS